MKPSLDEQGTLAGCTLFTAAPRHAAGSGGVDRCGRLDWWADDQPLVEDGYATDLLTTHAVNFIEQHRKDPFFLFLPHTQP